MYRLICKVQKMNMLSLVHSKAAAIYIIYGVEAYNKGNNTAASSDLAQASQYMNSSDKHAHRAASLLKAYNSKN